MLVNSEMQGLRRLNGSFGDGVEDWVTFQRKQLTEESDS